MPYALYFNNGNLQVYENGTNRGIIGTYTGDTEYDVRIELKQGGGARYYIKAAARGFSANTEL